MEPGTKDQGRPIVGTILPFLRRDEDVFDPNDIAAMSTALDDVCNMLDLSGGPAREVMALRIIDLARTGERNPARLREKVLREVSMARCVGLDDDEQAVS
jgi:hypothetical protein